MPTEPPSLLRALVAFLALPGVVAYLTPLLFFRPASDHPWHHTGWAVVALGSLLLLWCVRDFFVSGRGTLAPWDPPRELVVSGPYRWSRNPMYIAVLIVLLGWHLLFQSLALFGYLAVVGLSFHLRILLHEEPFLAEAHPAEWSAYKAKVPRWLF